MMFNAQSKYYSNEKYYLSKVYYKYILPHANIKKIYSNSTLGTILFMKDMLRCAKNKVFKRKDPELTDINIPKTPVELPGVKSPVEAPGTKTPVDQGSGKPLPRDTTTSTLGSSSDGGVPVPKSSEGTPEKTFASQVLDAILDNSSEDDL
jgi:hypothetical protein